MNIYQTERMKLSETNPSDPIVVVEWNGSKTQKVLSANYAGTSWFMSLVMDIPTRKTKNSS